MVEQIASGHAPLSVQDLCLEIERTTVFLLRIVGSRVLADAQDDSLLPLLRREIEEISLRPADLASKS
jgi:hypothetical protein